MSHKLQLSKQRKGTVSHAKSKRHETSLMRAINRVRDSLLAEFGGLRVVQEPQWHLKAMIDRLKVQFPDVPFCTCLESSASTFPFVCFGDGCDFAADSSIVDRVKTIAMFGSLNEIHLHNEGPRGIFNRGTYYFRVPQWTEDEIYTLSLEVARRSGLHYFSKYGERSFMR